MPDRQNSLPPIDNFYSAALCKKCGQIKPQKDFVYFLTGAQAETRGYARKVRVKIDDGLICKACRPKRKKLLSMSEREINARVALGDLPPGDAAIHLAKRKATRRNRMAQGVDNRWVKEFRAAWEPALECLRVESSRMSNGASANRSHPQMRSGPYASARLAFYTAYLDALKILRAKLKQAEIGMANKRRRPWREWWVDYFDDLMPGERTRLWDLWEAIPVAGRAGLKWTPAVVSHDPLHHKESEPPYRAHDPKALLPNYNERHALGIHIPRR